MTPSRFCRKNGDRWTTPLRKRSWRSNGGEDFGSPHETALAESFDKPVFVYHYPTAVKAFYMTPVAGRPEVCRSVDLLAPGGLWRNHWRQRAHPR